jgi:hypothetical protein
VNQTTRIAWLRVCFLRRWVYPQVLAHVPIFFFRQYFREIPYTTKTFVLLELTHCSSGWQRAGKALLTMFAAALNSLNCAADQAQRGERALMERHAVGS